MDSVRFARIRLARRDFAPRLIEFSKGRTFSTSLFTAPLFRFFATPPPSFLPSSLFTALFFSVDPIVEAAAKSRRN